MSRQLVVDGLEQLRERLARCFEREALKAIAARGRFTVALAGGSVASSYFPRLAAVPVDWSRTDFFWADERAVSADHPQSNFAVARRLWLEPARVPAERIHRMEAEAADPERTATAYAETLAQVAGAPPRLDFVLLGVGADGHVCSLFPGHPALREGTRSVLAIHDSPKPPGRRLTLTLPVLTAAKLVVVAAAGSSKAAVVREALEREDSPLPVSLLARGARCLLFLLEVETARSPQAPGRDLSLASGPLELGRGRS
jgi:6-phosphogluconolactonase